MTPEYLRYRQTPQDVRATPMTLRKYNIYRGWSTPSNQNPEAKGFHVISEDGTYEAWVPAEKFLATHTMLDTPPPQVAAPGGINDTRMMGEKP